MSKEKDVFTNLCFVALRIVALIDFRPILFPIKDYMTIL